MKPYGEKKSRLCNCFLCRAGQRRLKKRDPYRRAQRKRARRESP